MGKLWSQSYARRSLLGGQTMNPSIAATSLLGKRRVAKAKRKLKKAGRRQVHRGNPAPALVAALAPKLLAKIPGLSGLFKKPSEERARPIAEALVQSALQGNLTAARAIHERTTFGIAKERAVWTAAKARIPGAIWALVDKNYAKIPGINHSSPETAGESALASPFGIPGVTAGVSGTPSILEAVTGSPLAVAVGKQLVSRATRAPRVSRARRPRQVTRYDPSTGDKYKVPSDSAEAMQWPSRKSDVAGLARRAAPVAGLGAAGAGGVAGAGALATAGVVIGGLAVGVLIGTALRRFFGTAKAVRAEEAAVQGALALRNTRASLEAQLGRKLVRAETQALFAEYTAQLQQLGFVQNPQGMWHRPRSAVERLLG